MFGIILHLPFYLQFLSLLQVGLTTCSKHAERLIATQYGTHLRRSLALHGNSEIDKNCPVQFCLPGYGNLFV